MLACCFAQHQLSRECQDIPLLLGQPGDTVKENLAVKDRLHHPLFLDEPTEYVSVVLCTVGQRLRDGLGMKITLMGGIPPMTLVLC